jgi:thiamine-monophosphate kinase
LIDWIRTQQTTSESVPLAAGDDLAILKFAPNDLVIVGIDQVLDGIHFLSAEHAPELIGRKAMNRNLSDCAAMACLPAAAVVSFALPRRIDGNFVKRLYAGLKEAGDAFCCPIVGGDTGSWGEKLAVTIAIIGRSAGVEPVRRSGAKPGEAIYVTGPLGGSIRGRHLTFTPRVREARELVARQPISAMIDLSDGLGRDLGHICRESGVGAILDADRIPIHDDVQRLNDGRSALEHALGDGEDHELCFTSGPREDAIRIGTITAERRLMIRDGNAIRPLAAEGFEHTF